MANRLGCLIGRHRRSAVRAIDGRAYAQCPDCGEMLIRRRFGWGPVLPNEAPDIRRLRRPAAAPPPAPGPAPGPTVVGIAVPGEEMVPIDLAAAPPARPAGLPSWVITGAWPPRDGQGARRIDPGHRLAAPPRHAALPFQGDDRWTIDQQDDAFPRPAAAPLDSAPPAPVHDADRGTPPASEPAARPVHPIPPAAATGRILPADDRTGPADPGDPPVLAALLPETPPATAPDDAQGHLFGEATPVAMAVHAPPPADRDAAALPDAAAHAGPTRPTPLAGRPYAPDAGPHTASTRTEDPAEVTPADARPLPPQHPAATAAPVWGAGSIARAAAGEPALPVDHAATARDSTQAPPPPEGGSPAPDRIFAEPAMAAPATSASPDNMSAPLPASAAADRSPTAAPSDHVAAPDAATQPSSGTTAPDDGRPAAGTAILPDGDPQPDHDAATAPGAVSRTMPSASAPAPPGTASSAAAEDTPSVTTVRPAPRRTGPGADPAALRPPAVDDIPTAVPARLSAPAAAPTSPSPPSADGGSWAAMMAASLPAPPPAPAPAPPAAPPAARSASDLAAVAIARLHGSAAGAHALARLALARDRGDTAGIDYWQGIVTSLARRALPSRRPGGEA